MHSNIMPVKCTKQALFSIFFVYLNYLDAYSEFLVSRDESEYANYLHGAISSWRKFRAAKFSAAKFKAAEFTASKLPVTVYPMT